MLRGTGATDVFERPDDTPHLYGSARMGFSREDSVVDSDRGSWSVKNLFVCDGSTFPANGGVIPRRTIQALALRTAHHIDALSRRGEL